MIPCARFAFFTLTRDSLFVALAASLLMVAFSFRPPLAFEVGASVALVFSICLLARGYFLNEERFRRSEAWRALTPEERPAGDVGPQLAQEHFKTLLLRFAQGASAIAAFLYASALLLSVALSDPGFDAIVTAGLAGAG
jgi:hypothetical protein